jgi:VCBS repeat-containing protein
LNNAATITADAGIAPDGTLTADRYTGGQGSSIRQTTTDSFATGTTITFSLYVKADGRSTVQIRGDDLGAFSIEPSRVYDLTNLTSTASLGTTTGTITDVGNGWRLLTLSAVATNSGTFTAVIDGVTNGAETGGYLIWGAQVNVGAAKQYSATTTSSRSADSRSVVASDVDSGDAFTYTLVDTAGGRFAVNSSTGMVTVANGSLLDFESATSHNITVRATDLAGATFDKVMNVQVTNVNDTPVAVFDTATAVEAGGVNNGTVGTNPSGNVLTNDTDVDAGDTKVVSGVVAGTSASASGSVGNGVTGTFGSINIAANGAYTYTVDNSNATVQALRTSGQTLSDVFTYTMRDTAG